MSLGEERGDVIRLTPNDRPGSLTPERQTALLAYCKLTELADDPEVQVLIPALYASAVGYMTNAGIAQPEPDTPRTAQYDLCVNYLVLDAWERRETAMVATVVEDNPAFRRLINQLKLTEPDRQPSAAQEVSL